MRSSSPPACEVFSIKNKSTKKYEPGQAGKSFKGVFMQKSREETMQISLSSRMKNVPWWALIIVATGFFLLYLILADPNYRDTFTFLKDGVAMTLYITMLAFPIATVIGLFTGLMRTSKNVVLYTISTIYVEVIRGIPLVVLILMVAFALVPLFVDLTKSIGDWGLARFGADFLDGLFKNMAAYSIRTIPMEIRAVIALAAGYGAFEAEIFRAGIQSISRGQMEAARSLGMSYVQSMRFIILPQAVRRVLPPLGNDFIAMLKDSSLATVLAVNELTQMTRLRRASTFRVMEAFNVAAFLYLSMTLVLSAAVRLLERKMRIEE
jgi:polar amino acid transport system permease protein